MSRLVWIIAILALVAGSFWLYNSYGHKDQLGSGLVISRESDSRDASNTPTANSEPTPSTADAATRITSPTQPTPEPPQPKPSAALPVSDSIIPNPTNGTVFAATGKYTWYRQGNITWRVDSATGSSCIAFATLEEWQKRIVYTHGCRNA